MPTKTTGKGLQRVTSRVWYITDPDKPRPREHAAKGARPCCAALEKRKRKRLQVTYVTMVPWGNETLRHHALGTPCAWPALNLLCNLTNGRARRHRQVTSETRKHKSTCGKAGDSLKSWRTALARMPEVWQRDAASRSLKEPWLHT